MNVDTDELIKVTVAIAAVAGLLWFAAVNAGELGMMGVVAVIFMAAAVRKKYLH